MTRYFLPLCALLVCGFVSGTNSSAQNPPPDTSSQSSNEKPASATSNTQPATNPTAPADAKKAKKVWTNEDVGGLTGPVSVVGGSKSTKKPSADSSADGQYIANTRKELAKLQGQLDDTNKQLADLKDFSDGKGSGLSGGGYQINKSLNRVPVDQQITALQAKKKDYEEKIAALLDDARKKGVEPGQLR